MRTVLYWGRFYEVCPHCGEGGHCYASGGDPSRCPYRKEWKGKIDRLVEPWDVTGNRRRDPAL
ncbi:hypothetical protein VB618_05710 [Microvirga sp. CF3062]|uniref:hypothetical protein n=1 Tax=Microvirga sp. CF3062 TaxID=3110182 RepID=UPI002E76792E|nr:hypothetical protein [Microvirga sp. CF3062]MEE1655685.1 hypothetical protein [Microvirga sp. CF3062]